MSFPQPTAALGGSHHRAAASAGTALLAGSPTTDSGAGAGTPSLPLHAQSHATGTTGLPPQSAGSTTGGGATTATTGGTTPLMDYHNSHFHDWISLKMDDRVFTVMRSTLLYVRDSMFTTLFGQTEDGEPPPGFGVMRDESHPLRPYVFDRSPRYFEPILNFLRTGELILDPTINPEGVLTEAQYFGIEPVVQRLEETYRGRRPAGELSFTRRDLEKALLTTKGHTGALRLQGMNFAGFDFSNMDLSGLNMSKCHISGACFKGADLTGTNLKQCIADEADFSGATLEDALLDESVLSEANFDTAICNRASFRRAKCCEAKFIATILNHAHMEGIDLTSADLTGARLQGAFLSGACLSGVERQGTNLTMGGVLA